MSIISFFKNASRRLISLGNYHNYLELEPHILNRRIERGKNLYFDRDVIVNIGYGRKIIDGDLEKDVTIVSDGSIAIINPAGELDRLNHSNVCLKARKDILLGGSGYHLTLKAGRHIYSGPARFEGFGDEQVSNILSQSFEGMSEWHASKYEISLFARIKAGGMVKLTGLAGDGKVDAGETAEIKWLRRGCIVKEGKPAPVPPPKVKKIFSAEATRLADDPRVAIASCVEEFSRIKDDDSIRAMIMPNPVPFPTDPEEIAVVIAATKEISRYPGGYNMMVAEAEMAARGAPECIRKTARLMSEAFKHAAGKEDFRWFSTSFYLTQNMHYPTKPVYSDLVCYADVFGSTKIIYKKGFDESGPHYSLPAHHIAVLKNIHYRDGDPQPGVMKMTMRCSW